MAPACIRLRSIVLAGLLCGLVLPITACDEVGSYQHLRISQVSFTNTVVNPGETIRLSAVLEGEDSPSFVWSAEAGEFATPSEIETDWTAPDAEQLVQVSLTVSDSNDRETAFSIDILVGDGVDHDGDGFSLPAGDCDDTNAAIYPGAPDTADGIDNDCDGEVDEGALDFDDDGDSFTDIDGDCDDSNEAVFPGADEVANAIDDDCDGVVDEGTDAYDDDGDGVSEEDGDCNDSSSSVSPTAPEALDGVDNDCDGTIDEGTAAYDDDGDTYTELGGDCDDDPSTGTVAFPGNPEVSDGIDNDCDGFVDEDFLGDSDGDGWSVLAGDCDDDNFFVFQGAPEFADGIDNDCDGDVDEDMDTSDDDDDGFSEADGDCDDTTDVVYPGAPEVEDPDFELDNDCDGYFAENPPMAAITLQATDGCSDGQDNDGDGWTDASDPDCVAGTTEQGYGGTACNDSVDGDGDGSTDSEDGQCANGMDDDEEDSSADDCMDGQDNDGDGWSDADDPDCVVAPFNELATGATECSNGTDDDGDGSVDADDSDCDDGFDGSESSSDPDDCSDGEDGDSDGWIDAADPDCRVSPFDEAGVGTSSCNDGIDNDEDDLVDTADTGCGTADGNEGLDNCETLSLIGSDSSDPDGDSLSYYWFFDVQPINSNLTASAITGGTSETATFSPDVAGFWTVALIVSDGQTNSDPALYPIEVEQGSCE